MNQSRNTTCRDTDHDWQSTTSDTYRLCRRQGCRAGQRRVSGIWQDVSPRSRSRKIEPEQEHLLLWDEHSLLACGLHPRQREIERDAERRYRSFTMF